MHRRVARSGTVHRSLRPPALPGVLHKRVWLSTLERAGLRRRGQYNVRDSFISIALSSGRDPGWVAKVCDMSEGMIFRHYRSRIPGLKLGAGSKVGRVLGGAAGVICSSPRPPSVSPTPRVTAESQRDR